MFGNQEIFTVEEVNLMCIFDVQISRSVLITELINAKYGFDDEDLIGIAENALLKLEKMSDTDFAELKFYPIYDDDEQEVQTNGD
jgi:hypothetical protein